MTEAVKLVGVAQETPSSSEYDSSVSWLLRQKGSRMRPDGSCTGPALPMTLTSLPSAELRGQSAGQTHTTRSISQWCALCMRCSPLLAAVSWCTRARTPRPKSTLHLANSHVMLNLTKPPTQSPPVGVHHGKRGPGGAAIQGPLEHEVRRRPVQAVVLAHLKQGRIAAKSA